MSKILTLLLAACIAPSPALSGDLYRWVDADGGVHYADQPPPSGAKSAQKFQAKGNVVEVDKESYATRYAKTNQPVVLYASNCGPVCDQARDFLSQRGIPFSTKDPAKDPEIALELKRLTGKIQVPVIKIGKQHQMGFEATSWDSMLDTAGYPQTPLTRPQAAPQPAGARPE